MKIFKIFCTIAILAAGSACATQYDSGELRKSIKTAYPTKDWVISDYVVTDFGAKAEPGFDNRVAFQAAIDSAFANGGGVVYVPAGNYEFRSTQTGTRKVRRRQGKKESLEEFSYEYVLALPTGVQLRGDWADPQKNDGKVLGTILEVRVGKDSKNYDGSVESWWNDGQAGNALRTTFTSIADRFIDMGPCTGVTNLSIWYPEQDIDDIRPYPWTLFQREGKNAAIENVTLVNSYNGFYSAPSELHYVLNSYITALSKGVEIHVCTDIGRIENVKISPRYWAMSGLPGAPSLEKLEKYTKANGTGFEMHRSDWEYISYLDVSGYRTGIWIGREPGYSDAPNSQLFGLHVDDCVDGLFIEDVNGVGLMISDSYFGSGSDGCAVRFKEDYHASVQFNGVDFRGPVVNNGKGGVISFESCTFDDYDEYAIQSNGGNLLLTQCSFMKDEGHVCLGRDASSLKSVNSGRNNSLKVDNKSRSANVEVRYGEEYAFEPIPRNIKTNAEVYPRPSSDNVLRGNFSMASGYNSDAPVVDVSADIQKALDYLKRKGGGTLYLPAGRYLLDNPIKIPSGVEIRGSWDVPHHTMGGGTILFTNYDGGEKGEAGTPLIRLEESSGIRGVMIAQANLVTDGHDMKNPRRTPFLIQGLGPKVYVVNVTISGGDKGIDLASYNTSGHFVDYLGGAIMRAGIWVGGGAEGGFIRNMQLNPHYGWFPPIAGQGFEKFNSMRYLQSNCSALKFADVKDETIFNNFVYGSVYGIHFLKDAVTGRYPGKMTVVGHGSDGCTYSLFVEDADDNTDIIGVNSELVNTEIPDEPLRAYVLMGEEAGTAKVSPKAKLTLYNSAFWGFPIYAAILNNGNATLSQANFVVSHKGLDVRGGKLQVRTTNFAQKMTDSQPYVTLCKGGESISLINNFYKSGIKVANDGTGVITGSDVSSK
jgi:hypothetical protein